MARRSLPFRRAANRGRSAPFPLLCRARPTGAHRSPPFRRGKPGPSAPFRVPGFPWRPAAEGAPPSPFGRAANRGRSAPFPFHVRARPTNRARLAYPRGPRIAFPLYSAARDKRVNLFVSEWKGLPKGPTGYNANVDGRTRRHRVSPARAPRSRDSEKLL